MYGWLEPKVAKEGARVLLPETWGLRVSLHGGQDWDDVSGWDRKSPCVLFPPLMKSTIQLDEESLFGGWGFSKSVTDIRPIQVKVFSGSDGVEKS